MAGNRKTARGSSRSSANQPAQPGGGELHLTSTALTLNGPQVLRLPLPPLVLSELVSLSSFI